jgi:trimeric autotransporter adhesin
VEEVLRSIRIAELLGEDSGFWQFAVKPTPDIIGTDFAEAASAACALTGSLTTPIKQVIFVSDGVANVGADVTTVLPCGGLVFQTFAVGPASSCAGDPNGLGSLQEIATLTGGSCFEIDDPTNLPDEIVPAIVQSQLVSLELSIDGGAFADISGSSSVALPAAGPVSVTFSHLVPGLAPGIHELCVRANGTDGGGAGSVTECIEVTVATIDLAPPAAVNELGTPGQTQTVTATVAAGGDGGVSGVTVGDLPRAAASEVS